MTMYTLELKSVQTQEQWADAGYRTGSMAELCDRATAQNTDYRIRDENGNVVWEFQRHE